MENKPERTKIDISTKYRFTYRGILAELNSRIGADYMNMEREKEYFTYYIYLQLGSFTDRTLADSLWIDEPPITLKEDGKPELRFYPYTNNSFLCNLELHGGITFYSKEALNLNHLNNNDGRIIKIGCDYNHLWDENWKYNLENIECDAMRTIDDLHSKTEYLLMCQWDGSYHKEEDMIYIKGDCYHKDSEGAKKFIVSQNS